MASEPVRNRPCGGSFADIIDSVGNTPMVELRRLSPKPGVRIHAKLESHNPTGSVKDRIAKTMIEKAEEEGLVSPGQTILEPTSGNTGISLGMICRRKGYQYGNEANPRAHYEGTAPEILEELDEVAAFVGGLGTGGTLMGVGRRLKEHDPETLIVAAEPMQGELVQGLRSLDDGFIPPIIDLSLLDRKIMVSNRDAIIWTKRLLEDEAVFAGVSSGAIASVAARIADEIDEGNIVFLIPDDGWKYLSSGVYTKPLEELEDIDSTVWW
jgi:cysteine synthase